MISVAGMLSDSAISLMVAPERTSTCGISDGGMTTAGSRSSFRGPPRPPRRSLPCGPGPRRLACASMTTRRRLPPRALSRSAPRAGSGSAARDAPGPRRRRLGRRRCLSDFFGSASARRSGGRGGGRRFRATQRRARRCGRGGHFAARGWSRYRRLSVRRSGFGVSLVDGNASAAGASTVSAILDLRGYRFGDRSDLIGHGGLDDRLLDRCDLGRLHRERLGGRCVFGGCRGRLVNGCFGNVRRRLRSRRSSRARRP